MAGLGMIFYKTAVGAEPEESLGVLEYVVYNIVGQSLLLVDGDEIVTLRIVAHKAASVGREPDVASRILLYGAY